MSRCLWNPPTPAPNWVPPTPSHSHSEGAAFTRPLPSPARSRGRRGPSPLAGAAAGPGPRASQGRCPCRSSYPPPESPTSQHSKTGALRISWQPQGHSLVSRRLPREATELPEVVGTLLLGHSWGTLLKSAHEGGEGRTLGGLLCKGSSWKSQVWKAWAWPPACPAQLLPRKKTWKRGAQRPPESLGHLQMQPCSGGRTPKPGSLQETPPGSGDWRSSASPNPPLESGSPGRPSLPHKDERLRGHRAGLASCCCMGLLAPVTDGPPTLHPPGPPGSPSSWFAPQPAFHLLLWPDPHPLQSLPKCVAPTAHPRQDRQAGP